MLRKSTLNRKWTKARVRYRPKADLGSHLSAAQYKTMKKYEKYFGIVLHEVIEPVGPQAKKSMAWRIAEGVSNFLEAGKGGEQGNPTDTGLDASQIIDVPLFSRASVSLRTTAAASVPCALFKLVNSQTAKRGRERRLMGERRTR